MSEPLSMERTLDIYFDKVKTRESLINSIMKSNLNRIDYNNEINKLKKDREVDVGKFKIENE